VIARAERNVRPLVNSAESAERHTATALLWDGLSRVGETMGGR
jgi:hypothetical protein